ncbi:MAG: class I SAM-dependent methyltransferase [Chloroflexi bacterium]|nr:class I SAM-dependent methyltransferase [Chloroflexota bacterium]
MRLPDAAELRNDDHRALYRFDIRELHHPDPYVSRLGRIGRIYRTTATVKKLVRSGRCLDIACAQGSAVHLLAESGYTTVGVDLNPNYLTYALLKRESGSAHFVSGNAESLPVADGAFDVVIMGEILEHAAFPDRLVLEARRCLADDGHLIITTPNGHRIHSGLITYHEAQRQADTLKDRQYQPSGEGHLFAFTLKELRYLVEGLGFRIVEACHTHTLLLNRAAYLKPLHLPVGVFLCVDSIVAAAPLVGPRLSDALFIVAVKK